MDWLIWIGALLAVTAVVLLPFYVLSRREPSYFKPGEAELKGFWAVVAFVIMAVVGLFAYIEMAARDP